MWLIREAQGVKNLLSLLGRAILAQCLSSMTNGVPHSRSMGCKIMIGQCLLAIRQMWWATSCGRMDFDVRRKK